MSQVIPFRCSRPAVHPDAMAVEPAYITLADCGNQLFVMDADLGEALGFVDPLAAVQHLLTRYRADLERHVRLIELFEPASDGRKLVSAFDLEGAMWLCKLARTPSAGMVYARLGGRAIAEFVVVDDEAPRAQVIPFPRRKRGGGRRKTKGVFA